MFKPTFSVVPVGNGFAVAVHEKPTGQVYGTNAEALAQIEVLKAKRAAKAKIQKAEARKTIK